MMEFNAFLQEKIALVDDSLKGYMEYEEKPQKKIYEAMNYSLFAGGKRLRPVIALMTAQMCGASENNVLPFACALEMIHTYSLIHDDLPSMDNDDTRRGKPTNHKVYGEAMAILAGDALLNKAMETAVSANVAPEITVKALKVLFSSSGTEGMIGGQVIDIENIERTEDELKNLHLLKTGALIRAAGLLGGIVAEATSEELMAIDEFCTNLGIAFQIQDDILDVEGNEEKLGKPVGSDADNDKTTYVTLFGVEKSKALVKEYTDKAKKSITDKFSEKSEKLNALADYLIKRNF